MDIFFVEMCFGFWMYSEIENKNLSLGIGTMYARATQLREQTQAFCWEMRE